MPEAYAGFIDAGFLHAEGARKLGHSRSDTSLNAEEIVAWFRRLVNHRLIGEREEFLRAYWYDGAFEHSHPGYANQLRYFDAIASTPRIQLRLGHIAERQSPLERPIRSALDNTAQGLGIGPGLLRQEFNRHWTFRPQRQQKGVDTLIALDMVRLASRLVCTTAILVSGDRDMAEVVRTTQDFGVRTLVATPRISSVARELAQLADDVIVFKDDDLHRMLSIRAG